MHQQDHIHIVHSDGQSDGVVFNSLDGAVDPSDGGNLVASFEIVEHFFYFFVLFPLRTNQHKPEYNEYKDYRKERNEQAERISGGV